MIRDTNLEIGYGSSFCPSVMFIRDLANASPIFLSGEIDSLVELEMDTVDSAAMSNQMESLSLLGSE